MVTIMARIYSDEEIERLSRNPYVSHVSRQRMSLTLDFRQYMYDRWIQNPVPSTIKNLLLQNGFESRDIGTDFYKNIATAFKRSGRPRWTYGPAYNTEITTRPAPAEKQEAGTIGKSPLPALPNEGNSEREAIRNSLIRSGRFVANGPATEFSPGYAATLFSTYPQSSLYEALSAEGYTAPEIGEMPVHELEKTFSLCRAAGTAPYESREEGHLLEEDEAAVLRRNPFVESASPTSVTLNEKFFLAAAALKELGTDRVLDIFMAGHRNFTIPEKTGIRNRLLQSPAGIHGVDAFGGTAYDAKILRRRMEALEETAREAHGRISSRFPSLKPPMKKQVCLWVEGLPPDPGRLLTKKEILKQAGIPRSVYYKYVKDPDSGTWEIRKKERDAADARIVREAFEYKGFRKGSRQVYMLLPRLAGRSVSLKKIRRIMKEGGMECGIRRANPSRKGREAYEKESIKPNLLRRRFRLYRPNKVRVTDVTYLDYGDKKRAYGSALMDPVTGRLVAFVVSGKNDLEMALETLRVSDGHPCEDGGIFHSDQGTLYKAREFQKGILGRGLTQSMSKKGNCWDNATQESFFGHFKDECDYSSCADVEELRKKVEEYSDYYNNERGMWDKGRMTPAEYEAYLLGLNEEQFGEYLSAEEKKYDEMKKKAAELAKKRYGTLGV